MYETAGIITNDDMKHWVNIVGVSSNKNLSWFGGKIVNQFMFKIWNPIGRAILYKSSFSNVGFDNRDYCFWTIEQGQLYVLRWNDTNDEYYRVDADLFINDIAEDDYFEVL